MGASSVREREGHGGGKGDGGVFFFFGETTRRWRVRGSGVEAVPSPCSIQARLSV